MAEPPKEKPKTLDELELEAKTEDMENSDDTEHEHHHSDTITYKEDPGKIKMAHSLLIALSLGGLVVVMMVVGYLLLSFEGRNPITDPIESSIQESVSLIPLPGEVFYVNAGNTSTADFMIANSPDRTHKFEPEGGGSLQQASAGRNKTWQVSRDGNTIAFQTQGSNSVTVVTADETVRAFEGDGASSIDDWVLVPDGSRIIALAKKGGKTQLLDYNVINKTSRVGDASFSIGGNLSKLHNGRDGYVRQFSLSGNDKLTYLEYGLMEGKKEVKTISSPRFPDGPRMAENGLSPDGSLYVYFFTRDGQEYLGMVSLNSKTVRTVYRESKAGASLSDFYWGSDSRTLLIAESEGGRVRRLVKLDTGPITTETVIDASKEGLSASGDIARSPAWSLDAKSFTFYNGSSVWLYTLESGELKELMTNAPEPSASTVYGWYTRHSGVEMPQPETEETDGSDGSAEEQPAE